MCKRMDMLEQAGSQSLPPTPLLAPANHNREVVLSSPPTSNCAMLSEIWRPSQLLVNLVKEGHYINLALMLDNTESEREECDVHKTVVHHYGDVRVSIDNHKRSVSTVLANLEDWLYAFNRYNTVIAEQVEQHHPGIMRDIGEYKCFCQELSRVHGFAAMYKYDVRLRSIRTGWGPTARWAPVNSNLLFLLPNTTSTQAAPAESCGKKYQKLSPQATHDDKRPPGDWEQRLVDLSNRNICDRFNRGAPCMTGKYPCARRHICSTCEATDHTAKLCNAKRATTETNRTAPAPGPSITGPPPRPN